MKRALLVSMPFGGVVRPSLGLSLLKAALVRDGLPCDVRYFNIQFARWIGTRLHEQIADATPSTLLGDWLFAAALFGDGLPSTERYVADILATRPWLYNPDDDSAAPELVEAVLAVRERVPAFLDACLDALPWDDYALVGFTTTFQQHVASLALARRLKARYPHLAIVFGGSNCEGEMGAATHRLFPFVDFVCSGEGDLAFPLLARRVLQGRPAGEIGGIIRREGGQTIVPRLPTAPVLDMDALPTPDFDDFVEQSAALADVPAGPPHLFVETARGCWWGQKSHCTFCGLNGGTMQFRAKSPARALDELHTLIDRYQPSVLQAVDNIIDMNYFQNVLPHLAAAELEVQLFYETKANLRKEQVRLLRQAGVVHIQPGIESLSTNVLRLMRKGVTAVQNIQLLRWCAEYGVKPGWNLLAGFPGEDPADYERQAAIVPLLTHLTPPTGPGSVRLDRFSPMFVNPAAYDLQNIRPLRVYHYVYPFATEDLAALAYHFEFDYADGRDPQAYSAALAREAARWRAVYPRAELSSHPAGDALVIRDTRPVAVQPEHRLEGLTRALYEYCDQAHTAAEIADHLAARQPGGAESIAAALRTLEADRLLLHEDGRYLSLAVPTAYRRERFLRRLAAAPVAAPAAPALMPV